MKSLAIITALFLAQPVSPAPQQSLAPTVHKTNMGCGAQPSAPQGCLPDSARCKCSGYSCSWEWTC